MSLIEDNDICYFPRGKLGENVCRLGIIYAAFNWGLGWKRAGGRTSVKPKHMGIFPNHTLDRICVVQTRVEKSVAAHIMQDGREPAFMEHRPGANPLYSMHCFS